MAKKNTTTPLVLVDGSSYLFRAFHALPPLVNRHGEPTGAIHGVLNMLDKLRRDFNPELMVVVFDAKGKTFRNDLYPEYKGTRPPMPEDLRSQIEPLLEIIKAQGYPILIEPNVEADDVIGSLSTQYQGEVVISTGDKDMAQLVNERVSLINTMSKTFHDIDGVKDKYGVAPEQIRDYLTLMGDTSDNIPGVPKVGPKTAVKWLAHYGTLENVMENADEFKGKVGEYLRESLHFLPLSYQLVTIICDLELDCSDEALSLKEQDSKALVALYERYGFNSRLQQLGDIPEARESVAAVVVSSKYYEIIHTQTVLNQWLKDLTEAELFSFAIETTHQDYIDAEIVGLSFCIEAGKSAYLPLAHDYEDAPKQLDRDECLQRLKPILEDSQQYKVGHNLKYTRSVLLNYNIALQGVAQDTMLQSYVLNSVASKHDIQSLSDRYLNHKATALTDIAGKGRKQLDFNQIPVEKAATYASEQADISLRLHHYFWSALSADVHLKSLYETIELPLMAVLSNIERHGVLLNSGALQDQSVELAAEMKAVETECYALAGEKFTLNSPKQLQVILYDKLQIPIVKKTPKGQPSTSEEVLSELAKEYPLPDLILRFRSMSKLKSTYTDKLPLLVNKKTQRIHTNYHQAVTATGRLSSSSPNLQNIPIRTSEGRRIRRAFVAMPYYQIMAADYSQIELRIMAHLSQDAGLLEAFSKGLDVHKTTAAEVFSVDIDEVTDNQRRSAKAINFGLIYGMTAFGLAKQIGSTRTEAAAYVKSYFNRYPGVKDYMDNTRAKAKEQGFVETLFGRRLYLPDINNRNVMRRKYAERTAINAPMQGTAADIIKKAMVNVDALLAEKATDTRMIMQVHDELVFELPRENIKDLSLEIKHCMENSAELDVPLIVDVGIGEHWDAAH
ncbi:MAG: DNA polymerase I [Thiotrichaceae bacterium]|nr:DNA polymerase I [Thiotrichaceae bacterium]